MLLSGVVGELEGDQMTPLVRSIDLDLAPRGEEEEKSSDGREASDT